MKRKKIALVAVGAGVGCAVYLIRKYYNKKRLKSAVKTETSVPYKQGFYEKYIKRPQDFFCALLAIVVLSPVMLIKLGSPVIFKQERPGLNGEVFTLYKFRTMTDAKDENGELLHDEVRLTPFGRMLRTTSIDELPELINILKGDMAVVGPRPLLVTYLERYNAQQARRHEVRPGFTGYAQVHGRNAITWEDKFDKDIYYVDHITFLGDWKIIFKTIKTVLKREGISSDSSVTMEEFMGTNTEDGNLCAGNKAEVES